MSSQYEDHIKVKLKDTIPSTSNVHNDMQSRILYIPGYSYIEFDIFILSDRALDARRLYHGINNHHLYSRAVSSITRE